MYAVIVSHSLFRQRDMSSKAVTFIEIWKGATTNVNFETANEPDPEQGDDENPQPRREDDESAQFRAQFRQVGICLFLRVFARK